MKAAPRNHYWLITFAAAATLVVTMGSRQSLGLFVSPINTSTGLGITAISLALAIGQFAWGAVQPFAGAIADRYGAGRVLAAGIVTMATGIALTPLTSSSWGLIVSMGILTSAGSGAGGFAVLIGAVSRRVPLEERGMAAGIINAGGSLGQFIFAPLIQRLISLLGWMGAMGTIAAITLASLPLARALRRQAENSIENTPSQKDDHDTLKAVRHAFANPSYLLLHSGFFTCGFHIAFLVTHLPGEVQLCGLPAQVASWTLGIIGLSNIVGSLVAGWCVQNYRSKLILFWMYSSRSLLIIAYLCTPKTALTFYVFAAGLGVTWLATVPPTAGLVGKLFGTRYLGTLFGLTLLSHQIGGFFGAWLGGLAISRFGNYQLIWYADIVLAALAALLNLPITEAKPNRRLIKQEQH